MTRLFFAHPEWLSGLVAAWLCLVVAVLLAIARSRRRTRKLLGDSGAAPLATRQRPLRDIGPLLALGAIAIALLGPRFGESVVLLSTSGVDVVVLLDTSQSMDARDVPPSRMDAARAGAQKILAGLSGGDRAALAIFAGRGLLLTPLSPDHQALEEMLDAVDSSLVKPGGSNLQAGIESALGAFERSDNRPRAIFLLSDGETLGTNNSEIGAIEALRADTRVFAAAIGTEEGSTVPDHGVPLRDSRGEIVTSRRRTRSLAKLTDDTGGSLFVADEWGRFDVTKALSELRAPVAAVPGSFVPHRVTLPVVLPFAAAAFILLFAEWMPLTRKPAPRRPLAAPRRAAASLPRATLVALIGAGLLLLGASESEPRDSTAVPDGRALLAKGLVHAKQEAWQRAEQAFLAAAIRGGASETTAIALHNLGVVALARDDLETAREAFFDSLAAGSTSLDTARRARTQWNLEWVLTKLTDPSSHAPELNTEGQVPEEPEDAPRENEEDGDPNERNDPEPDARADNRTNDERTEDGPTEPPPSTVVEAERAGGESAKGSPIALDRTERERWLSQVKDDPRKAMLAAAFEGEPETRPERGEPSW